MFYVEIATVRAGIEFRLVRKGSSFVGKLGDLGLQAANRLVGIPPVHTRPAGRLIDLPGRGRTLVTDLDDQPDGHSAGTAAEGDERPTLVLLHALATTGQLCWYPVMNTLREHYRVVTFDQRGHGQGIRPHRFRLEDCADDAVAVADALGIDRFIAVGYSMGSLVAPLTWKRHRDRVAGLVLGAAADHFQHTRRERLTHYLVNAAASSRVRVTEALPLVRHLDSRTPHERWAFEQFRLTRPAAIREAIAEIMKYDATSWAHEIDVPTSFVVTTLDRVIPPHRQRWLAGRIQHSTMYDVNAGHGACVLQADVFTPALTVACASVASRIPATQHLQSP